MSIIKNGNKIAGNYKIQVATEATTEKSGAIRIATEEEAKAGILDNVAITPKQLGEVASSIDIPPATQETIGLVKPDGETIVIDEDGTISAITSGEYTLPTASTDILGGVKVDGETITINDDGQISSAGGGLPMFTPIWADHLYNDASYLRADTFSWHSGDIYVTAYNILLEEYNNENCVEETENGIVYKRTPSGFKIANADQNDIILNIYNDLGIAWYYIIDTVNKQFKLPRTKYGFNGLRDKVGGNIDAGLPTLTTDSTGAHTHTRGTMDITGQFYMWGAGYSGSGAITASETGATDGVNYATTGKRSLVKLQASNAWTGATSSDGVHTHTIEGNSDTVQPPATQMYLYFYIGNYQRPATEIQTGKVFDVLANKADIDGGNYVGSGLQTILEKTTLGTQGGTLTGQLTVRMENNALISTQTTSIAYDQIPSTSANFGEFAVRDKNGDWMALYGAEKYTDGRNLAKMQVRASDGTHARIQIWADKNNQFYCDFPKCTTKATTTSSASSYKVAVITQNYVSGTSWYRVWSDGWIEQGGQIAVTSKGSGTVNLLKAFSNTNYTLVSNAYSSAEPTTYNNAMKCYKNNASSIGWSNASNSNTFTLTWYACGY